MTTLGQLTRSRKALPSVIVLTGKSSPLRRWAIQTILTKRQATRTLKVISTTDMTTTQLVEDLSRLPAGRTAILYGPLENCGLLAPLNEYARSPRKYLTLILWATEKKQANEMSWLTDGPFITRVEVGSGYETDRLRSFARAVGVSVDSVDALLQRVGEDPELLVEALRILQVMPRPWDWELIKRVIPDATPTCSFAEFHVASHSSPYTLCQQLARRFRQLALLATYKPLRLSTPVLTKETGVPSWLLKEFVAMTKHKSASVWIHRLVLAQKGAEYAKAGMPLVKEWLRISL